MLKRLTELVEWLGCVEFGEGIHQDRPRNIQFGLNPCNLDSYENTFVLCQFTKSIAMHTVSWAFRCHVQTTLYVVFQRWVGASTKHCLFKVQPITWWTDFELEYGYVVYNFYEALMSIPTRGIFGKEEDIKSLCLRLSRPTIMKL